MKEFFKKGGKMKNISLALKFKDKKNILEKVKL